jgi:hypothetical protein
MLSIRLLTLALMSIGGISEVHADRIATTAFIYAHEFGIDPLDIV